MIPSRSTNKKIIKTGAQVRMEEAARKKDTSCPECGYSAFAGIYHNESYGFLGLKTRRVTTYNCPHCRCKYEIKEDI